MKRHNLKPRQCTCDGTCQKCDGMIKPYEFDTPLIFERRKFCCRWCPQQTVRKKGYRHTKKPYVPAPPSNVDLFLMGKL